MNGEVETKAFTDISFATLGQAVTGDGVRVVVIYPQGMEPPAGEFEAERIALLAKSARGAARAFWAAQS